MDSDALSTIQPQKSRCKRAACLVVGLVLLWLVTAYVIVPFAWKRYARRHADFDANPRITQTGDGHPGDPLNVALIGTKTQLEGIMQAAKWYPAAPLSLASDLEIAADTILSRPDDEAPVSNLYLFGRKEDAAFEQPVGGNPRHRHHIRFWRTGTVADDGRPQWIGSAVYDKRVGLSHTTGQITHVTAPDIDTERDYLFECLERTGDLVEPPVVVPFHKQLEGRNGGGNRWRTDGDLYVGVIASPE